METNSSAPKKFTLNKKERLKSRTLIQTLFTLNQTIRIYPFKLVWMEIPNQTKGSIDFGVSVSKRNFKTAVMRNKIKRKIREAYRLNKFILLDKIADSYVKIPLMIIYTGKELVSYDEIQTKMKVLLNRLAEKLNQT